MSEIQYSTEARALSKDETFEHLKSGLDQMYNNLLNLNEAYKHTVAYREQQQKEQELFQTPIMQRWTKVN